MNAAIYQDLVEALQRFMQLGHSYSYADIKAAREQGAKALANAQGAKS